MYKNTTIKYHIITSSTIFIFCETIFYVHTICILNKHGFHILFHDQLSFDSNGPSLVRSESAVSEKVKNYQSSSDTECRIHSIYRLRAYYILAC